MPPKIQTSTPLTKRKRLSSTKNPVGASDATNMVISRKTALWRRKTVSQVTMTVRKTNVVVRSVTRSQSARDAVLSLRKRSHPRGASVMTAIHVESPRRAGIRAARGLRGLKGPDREAETRRHGIGRIGIEEETGGEGGIAVTQGR